MSRNGVIIIQPSSCQLRKRTVKYITIGGVNRSNISNNTHTGEIRVPRCTTVPAMPAIENMLTSVLYLIRCNRWYSGLPVQVSSRDISR